MKGRTMKIKWMLSWIIAGLLFPIAQSGAAEILKTEKDRLSYSVGVDVAKNFKKEEIEIDPDVMLQGIKDGLSGGKLLMSEKEVRQVLSALQSQVRQKMAANRQFAAEDNRKKGAAFLKANKLKDGVATLPSGIQYKVLKAGHGPKPADASTVECTYRGTLIDGTEFDATEPGKPATLQVERLVAGLKEAVKLMPAGSTWRIFIPSQLAFGERGSGNSVGPNATVVYEVELLAVK